MTDLGRVAIAHEWVAARAGSEKVFEELALTYPDADLYAMTVTPGVDLDVSGRAIRTTPLDRLGGLRDRRGLLLPVMPGAWRVTGRRERYDTVITSSHACVKGFRPGREARHLCYVHAPMRYAWNPEIDDRGAGRLAGPARAVLRRWDLRSTRWVDSFAANSSAVAERIERFYGRGAQVIHPPVDTDFFAGASEQTREGLVTLGRFIPYKGHDIAIRVAAELDVPIKVVGRGPEEDRLRAVAASVGARAEFVVGAPDDVVRDAVASARALVFAAHEDFGIVPVEAQAAGTPVVGPALGGLVDTVAHGVTGMLAPTLSGPAIASATQDLLASSVDPHACRDNAARFGRERFRREIRQWVER
ncbi:glycosyltransferase family 4 protein [Nocardioides maradonensis]